MDKIAFICTTHQSRKHRPNGFDLFNSYLESLYSSCKYPFKLFAFDNASEDIKLRFEDKVTKIQQGDDLLPTVMKVVKVFVAVLYGVTSYNACPFSK